MNRNKVKFTTNLFSYILIIFAIYAVLITILLYANTSKNYLLNTGIIMLVPFVQYFVGYIKSPILFIASHFFILTGCTVVIILGTFEIVDSLLYSIVWIALFIILFVQRMNENPMNLITSSSFAPIIYMIIAYFISSNKATVSYNYVISILTIVSIVIYFCGKHLANSYTFYEGNVLSGVMNYERSMKFSNKLVGGFITLSAAVMFFASLLPSIGLVNFIKHILFLITKWLVSFLVQDKSKAIKVTPTPLETNAPISTQDYLSTLTQGADNTIDIDKYMNIIFIIIALVMTVLVLYGFFSGIKRLEKKNLDEEKFFISPFEKETELDLNQDSNDLEKESFFQKILSQNPNKRIRRIFKKTVFVNMDINEKIKASYTPTQLCNATSIRKRKKHTKWDTAPVDNDIPNDDLEALRILYEQARYSNEPCTKNDVSLAQQLQKNT